MQNGVDPVEDPAGVDGHRRGRILRALAGCMAEKGYQATTIADIARVARVSRTVARTQQEARAAGLPWRERTRAVIGAYLEALAAGPAVAWAAVVEVQAAGRSALELRRTVIDRYVDLLTGAAAELADRHPDEVRPVDRALLLAAVGGINELLLARVERGEADRLAEDADSATAVVGGAPRTPPLTAGPVPE